MIDIFAKILNMNICAGILVLVVLLLRLVLRKAPKKYICILWAIVALKLVLPFTFESRLSVYNLFSFEESNPFIENTLFTDSDMDDKVLSGNNTIITDNTEAESEPIFSQGSSPVGTIPAEDEKINQQFPAFDINENMNDVGQSGKVQPEGPDITYLIYAWMVGTILLLAVSVAAYLRLRKEVAASILTEGGIYVCDNIRSPFILGMIMPKIYLPSGIIDVTRKNVIAHENAHLQRLDHYWKPLGYILLCIHWINPLMWIAYILFCQDIEAACDEKVIAGMNKSEIIDYSNALVDCALHRRMITACPVAFGETNVKKRVANILSYKKPAFWVGIVTVIICCVVAVGFLTNPKSAASDNPKEGTFFENQYEGKYVCEVPYYAYINEYNNVIVHTEDETKQITDSGDVVKIVGGELCLILLRKDGTLSLYIPESGHWISQADLDKIGPEGNRMEQVWKLVVSAADVEDMVYNGSWYLAVKVNGEWKDCETNSRCAAWNEQQLIKIVFDYTGNNEIGIRKDGTVWGSGGEYFDLDDYNGESKKIVNIDCAFWPYIIYEDGTVESIEKSPYYAGNVLKWENVCRLSADAYVTAALTQDGRVLVYAPQNDDFLMACQWKNIKYIKACEKYLLGVDADGKVLVTPYGAEPDYSTNEEETSQTHSQEPTVIKEEAYKSGGYVINVQESDDINVVYSPADVAIHFANGEVVSLNRNDLPAFVDYDTVIESDYLIDWFLGLADGTLYDRYSIDEYTNCNIFIYDERIPFGMTEFETIIPRQGYMFLFSSPESDKVFQMFCPYEWDIDKAYEVISKIDIHYSMGE